uniref:Uncharacterized protein n=1 Tax=Oryza brachyantha TaxID=4533 RepID=J3NAK3_ORYBR
MGQRRPAALATTAGAGGGGTPARSNRGAAVREYQWRAAETNAGDQNLSSSKIESGCNDSGRGRQCGFRKTKGQITAISFAVGGGRRDEPEREMDRGWMAVWLDDMDDEDVGCYSDRSKSLLCWQQRRWKGSRLDIDLLLNTAAR